MQLVHRNRTKTCTKISEELDLHDKAACFGQVCGIMAEFFRKLSVV